MTPETKEKMKEVKKAGYTIERPNKIYHVRDPEGSSRGFFSSEAEAVKHAYRVMRGKK